MLSFQLECGTEMWDWTGLHDLTASFRIEQKKVYLFTQLLAPQTVQQIAERSTSQEECNNCQLKLFPVHQFYFLYSIFISCTLLVQYQFSLFCNFPCIHLWCILLLAHPLSTVLFVVASPPYSIVPLRHSCPEGLPSMFLCSCSLFNLGFCACIQLVGALVPSEARF